MWKELGVKAQCDWEKAEKRTREEKGKDKVCGTSIRLDALLTSFYRRSLSCHQMMIWAPSSPSGRGEQGRKGRHDSHSSPAAAASIRARHARSPQQGQRG